MSSSHVRTRWSRGLVQHAFKAWPRLRGDAQSKATAQATPEGIERHEQTWRGSWQGVTADLADFEAAVEALPDDQADALRRCERDGQTAAEAARRMGRSRRAVRYLLKKGRRNVENTLVG